MTGNSEYQVVFDISQKGFAWWFPACGLLLVLVGVAILFVQRRFPSFGARRRFVTIPFMIFGVMWTVVVFGVTYGDYARANKVYRNSEFYVVEGVVTNFRPMSPQAHGEECFSVEDRSFCYSDFVVTPGFNQSSTHGGPIRQGLPVRIEYIDDTILRLEVRTNPERKEPTPVR